MGCIRGAEEALGPWRVVRQLENRWDAEGQEPIQV